MPKKHTTQIVLPGIFTANVGTYRAPRRPPVTLTCLRCGHDFRVASPRKDTARYCSKQCYILAHRAGIKTWQCLLCGGERERRDRFGARQFRFCGKVCAARWRWTQDEIRTKAGLGMRAAHARDPCAIT